jgi:hypothetical protein
MSTIGFAAMQFKAMLTAMIGKTNLLIEPKLEIGNIATDARGNVLYKKDGTTPQREPANGNCKVTKEHVEGLDGNMKERVNGYIAIAKFSNVNEAFDVAFPKALARTHFVVTSDQEGRGGKTPDTTLELAKRTVKLYDTPELRASLKVFINDREKKLSNTVSFVALSPKLAGPFKFSYNNTNIERQRDAQIVIEILEANGFAVTTLAAYNAAKLADPQDRIAFAEFLDARKKEKEAAAKPEPVTISAN